MTDQAARLMRVWRVDKAGGGLTGYTIPVHEGNQQAYAGPRYLIRHAELDMHPLDARDRRAVLREEQGLGLCNITKYCTEVCPAGIKITDNAIIPMKQRSADQRYDPLGRVLRSWRRREDRPPGRVMRISM